MKQKLILWLISLLTPSYSRREKEMINRFKSYFHIYFEGIDCDDAIDPHLISTFGITGLRFEFKDGFLHIWVILERPGLLIGKGGKTIDGLNKWLESSKMIVHIKESKLWNYIR